MKKGLIRNLSNEIIEENHKLKTDLQKVKFELKGNPCYSLDFTESIRSILFNAYNIISH